MNLLFVMSASGSCLVLLYMILKCFAGEYLTAKWKSRILRMALFFYLCPYPLAKLYAQRFNYLFFKDRMRTDIVYYKDMIQITSKALPSISLNMTYKYLYLAGLVIVNIILIYGVKEYQKQKNSILCKSIALPCGKIAKCVKEQAKELKIKRKIVCKYCQGAEPVSVGILRPVLILNDLDLDEPVLIWILKHELLHIKNYDLFIRIVSMIVFAFNFYNPLALYLLLEIVHVSELVCDEELTASFDEKERVQYCQLLFETACKKREQFLLVTHFNHRFKLKERIEMILRGTRKKKGYNSIVNLVTTCFIICIFFVSIIVYEQPDVMDLRNSEMKIERGYNNDAIRFFVEEGEEEKSLLSTFFDDGGMNLNLDGYFVDEEGNQFLTEEQEQKECKHHDVKGICYEHDMNGQECVYRAYNAKRCKNCGRVVNGETAHEFESKICPH